MKGPKFCPTSKGNFLEMKAALKDFTRKLKLKEKFHGATYKDESLVKNKSKLNPSTENKELSKIIEIIDKSDPIAINKADNLTPEERNALKTLKNLDDIIIKKADKGNVLVILDKTFYRDKLVIEDHLKTETYKEVNVNADTVVFKELKLLLSKYKDNMTEKEFSYMTNFNWQSSNFYVLPKVHKSKIIVEKTKNVNNEYIEMEPPSDLKGRPIVSRAKLFDTEAK